MLISVFDEADIEDFHQEVDEAIVRAASGGDHSGVDKLIHQWQLGARTLADPVAVAILSGAAVDEDWVEVGNED